MGDAALTHLRGHREAMLVADGTPFGLRFVTDPAGRLVFPTVGAVLEAEDVTMFVPDEAPEEGPELQLMVSLAQIDSGDAACDRWRIYHGEPDLNQWGAATIEGARFAGEVVDAEGLAVGNPLGAIEFRLCKKLNADRPKLTMVCFVAAGAAIADPVAVGVDPEGIDIRARFGILRLPFREDAGDAEALIDRMLNGGRT